MGLKVAISLAVIGAVVAEINNPSGGLGAVVVLSGMSFDTPLAFAAIVLLALLSTPPDRYTDGARQETPRSRCTTWGICPIPGRSIPAARSRSG